MDADTVERVLSVEVDGGVVDVTIAEDEVVPGLVVLFVDTTPRRAVRVVVDGLASMPDQRA